MATEVFRDADYLSLPVPDGLKKGDAVRVGGLNGILATDRRPDTDTVTSTQGPAYGGGNPRGHASVWLKGGWQFEGIAFAVANGGAPIYITPANALAATDNSGANALYGHALTTKAAAAGPLIVRIAN